MKNTKSCPKCGSTDIVRIPDNPNRHASGNNIYTSTYTLFGKIPVIRYVCCSCGYAENWVENEEEFIKILYLIFDYPHKHYTFKYFEV